ncbi:unnamed protein product [Candidula unifasciata]|uniref:EF-hand domain-containing protein n=1 Tax=Candidula unifasciata TaxID=100452 RepID=A0A8S3Z6V3_9EUPU|nr:unnamed protein product [Candidula unifasciata]
MMIHHFEICVLVSTILLTLLPWHVVSQHQNQPHHQQQHHQPAQAGHGHHGKPLEFASEIHNADHILEHLQSVVSTKSKEQMTEEELEFHYFKLHDYDNNNKLDGVEIGKALTHIHEDGDTEAKVDQQPVMADSEIANIVDSVILNNDENNDGYIEYFEFKRRQSVAHHDSPSAQQHQDSPPSPAHEDKH